MTFLAKVALVLNRICAIDAQHTLNNVEVELEPGYQCSVEVFPCCGAPIVTSYRGNVQDLQVVMGVEGGKHLWQVQYPQKP